MENKDRPIAFYQGRVEQLTEVVNKLEKKSRTISFFRLLSGIGIIVSTYYLFKAPQPVLWAGLAVSLVIFLWLVKFSIRVKREKRFNEKLLSINEDEIKALSGDYSAFDGGKDLLNPDHAFSYDLDMFGPESIFQVINRTCTLQGREALADILTRLNTDTKFIGRRQKAIAELRSKSQWRQQYGATGLLTEESPDDKGQIENWLAVENKFYGSSFYKVIITLLPAITILAWLAGAFGFISTYVGACLSFLQLVVSFAHIKYTNHRQGLISKRIDILRKYYQLIEAIEDEEFTSAELAEVKQSIFHKEEKPSKSFAKIINLVDLLDHRMNIVLTLVLNGLLLWDLNCMYRIERWVNEFGPVFPRWIKAVATFDALSSLAGFMYNNPDYAIPEVTERDDFFMHMEHGGHPLLSREELVTNDVIQEGDGNIFLITGANMAGKSTFLRTVGLNLVLAMAGTCVCARRFAFTPVQLYTSMRTNDSLQKHTSFFFAELKRLKFIVEQLKKDEKCYVLLDEILKGTNSKDQHTGARRLIENMIRLEGVGMVATHDIALTSLEAEYPKNIKNIAFEIGMENNQMVFDYRYKEGVCQNMNATLLMEQMEIF
ncbi:hypothetical protein AB9P05_02875 [Roseivirga sp. BDSF3-8]|uniref:MutS-related protein n=1 Tax=Roseivirga sp. BDSF3-8 TaxID=3241598 RepID=UPI0035327AB8